MDTNSAAWYWIFSAGIPLVMVLITLGIGARIIAARTGAPVFKKWFVPLAIVAALFIFGQACYGLLNVKAQSQISTAFFLLMSVSCWAFLIHAGWRQRQAGDLLLDLGPPEPSRRRIIFGFILLSTFLGGRSGLDWAQTGFPSWGGLSETVMWATSGLFWLIALRHHLRITERGIVPVLEFIEWGRVLGYEWIGEDSATLLLRVRRRIPFIGIRTGLLTVTVPPANQRQLEEILAQQTSRARTELQ